MSTKSAYLLQFQSAAVHPQPHSSSCIASTVLSGLFVGLAWSVVKVHVVVLVRFPSAQIIVHLNLV